MTDQEIYKKIEETYNSEKGRGFITHLLRSFFPINKTEFLWSKPEKGQIRDCITTERLACKDELFELLTSDESRTAFSDNLRAASKATMDGDKTYETPDSVKELQKKGAPLALTSKGSNKYLSEQTFEEFYNFITSEMLKGNKHINWVINDEKSKEMVKQGYIKTKKEEKVVKKVIKRAKISLSDNPVLQELRKQLEKENGKEDGNN